MTVGATVPEASRRGQGDPATVFVSRKYPPAVGGMELLARLVGDALERLGPTRRIVLGRSQRHLPWFLPLALARTARLLAAGGVERVVCGDPVVLVALWPVLRASRARVAVVVHGLDLVYPNPVYRALVRRALRRADTVFAISAATRAEALRLGVPAARVVQFLPAVEAPPPATADRAARRAAVCGRLGLDPAAGLVVTIGRLVPRKGVRWFVEEVVPRLPEGARYVIAGAGPDLVAVRAAVAAGGHQHRVHVLGGVDEALRDDLLGSADVFAMPNVAVPGDMEGFGLVAVEAALRGTVVVASRLEGIEDAVVDGCTGLLCEPGDAVGFAAAVSSVLALDRAARTALGERYAAEAARRFGVERLGDAVATALA